MQAVEAIVEELKKISKKVSDRKEIAQVATVSANWDTTIGQIIADAMDKVGKDGTITVEEAKGIETTLEVVEGMQFDKGYLSPYFVTNPESMEVALEKARVEDALHATRAAVEEGVVAGGGVAYLRTQKALDSIKLEGDEAVGAEIVCRALEFPTGRLANYAGQEGALIVQEVKKRSGNEGFNVAAGKYEDLLKADVVDPTKVVRTALQNAASIAALMLTTEALVAAAWVVWITRPQPFQAEVETRSLSRTGGFPLCETSLLCRRASDSMCRLRFFRRWAFGPFDERRKQINWDRQNGRGLMLARNFLHCL
jgi:chaperonin GroEL (HSP60 family)